MSLTEDSEKKILSLVHLQTRKNVFSLRLSRLAGESVERVKSRPK